MGTEVQPCCLHSHSARRDRKAYATYDEILVAVLMDLCSDWSHGDDRQSPTRLGLKTGNEDR